MNDMQGAILKWQLAGYFVEIEPVCDTSMGVFCCTLVKQGELRVELVAPIEDHIKTPLESRLRRGGGLDHICYLVSDLNSALDQEILLGGILILEPIRAKTFDRYVSFVLRPSGILIELMESPKI